jgi:hypothetical protein
MPGSFSLVRLAFSADHFVLAALGCIGVISLAHGQITARASTSILSGPGIAAVKREQPSTCATGTTPDVSPRSDFGSGALACAAVDSPATPGIKEFDVPAQAAETGISTFAKQADLQILISARDAKGKRTGGVFGPVPVNVALVQLLEGTHLTARATGTQTYTLVRAPETTTSSGDSTVEKRGPTSPRSTGSRLPA